MHCFSTCQYNAIMNMCLGSSLFSCFSTVIAVASAVGILLLILLAFCLSLCCCRGHVACCCHGYCQQEVRSDCGRCHCTHCGAGCAISCCPGCCWLSEKWPSFSVMNTLLYKTLSAAVTRIIDLMMTHIEQFTLFTLSFVFFFLTKLVNMCSIYICYRPYLFIILLLKSQLVQYPYE